MTLSTAVERRADARLLDRRFGEPQVGARSGERRLQPRRQRHFRVGHEPLESRAIRRDTLLGRRDLLARRLDVLGAPRPPPAAASSKARRAWNSRARRRQACPRPRAVPGPGPRPALRRARARARAPPPRPRPSSGARPRRRAARGGRPAGLVAGVRRHRHDLAGNLGRDPRLAALGLDATGRRRRPQRARGRRLWHRRPRLDQSVAGGEALVGSSTWHDADRNGHRARDGERRQGRIELNHVPCASS